MTAAEAQQEEDTSASVRLLGDLREAFGDAEALYSTTVLERLHKLDEAPWADWYGHPLTTRDLAKLLRPYDLRPKSVREGGTGPSLKGYARADLYDAWRRYLPPPPHPPHPPPDGQSAAQPRSDDVSDPEPRSDTSATRPRDVADVSAGPDPSATGLTSHVADVADVSHTPGSNGEPSRPTTPGRVAPGSVWARNGAPQLAPDPDRLTHNDTRRDDPGR